MHERVVSTQGALIKRFHKHETLKRVKPIETRLAVMALVDSDAAF